MKTPNLPRLLYIGDVAIQSTVAGSALLYRLLQKYPPSHLRVVEGNLASSYNPNHRLPYVSYDTIFVGVNRLLHTRFHSAYRSYLFLTGSRIPRKLVQIFEQFQPDAILTVAHGFSWLAAAALAEGYKIPLHLIIHDDWPSLCPVLPWLKARANKGFGDVYRQAKSRFCVSPYMMEKYQKHYGVTGSVLYPSREEKVLIQEKHPKLESSSNSLVFVYAGSLHLKGYITALATLASVLENFGCSLIIYSSLTVAAIEKHGLQRSNVMVRSFIPQPELMSTLVREADVLFVPMTFEVEWREHMSLSFPSKLTDYTATSLPLLIWGPPYCSAVRWARENPEVAEVVDQEDSQELTMAVERLCQDPAYRSRLGAHASTKGQEYFSHAAVTQQFYQSITS